MAKKYKNKYKKLKETFEHMDYYFQNTLDDNKRYLNDIRYLEAFIEWKNLTEEYLYFKQNAYEKYDEDLPFPTLTL